MDLGKWIFGLIGHLGVWCLIFNRIHATAWPRSRRKFSEKAILAAAAIPPIAVVVLMLVHQTTASETVLRSMIASTYLHGCVVFGGLIAARWAWLKYSFELPPAVVESDSKTIDLAAEIDVSLLHGGFAKALGCLPINEVLKLTIQRMTLELNIPPSFDGLKICQLSDLHLTGQIGIEYFQRVVEEANKFEPDLIFITGDIVDEADCLDWLKPTLGQLVAKLGVFYVLGNHDLRISDETGYRKRLCSLGLHQASGKWTTLDWGESKIQITGNELPWYADAETLTDTAFPDSGLRILLSHSPDQLDWARSRGFDLMFAGHTHGGQIAFPIIGPVIAPSKYGVRYAGGTFQIDKMLMHVSRGISGDEPIRICSTPELGQFTLRSSPDFERASNPNE